MGLLSLSCFYSCFAFQTKKNSSRFLLSKDVPNEVKLQLFVFPQGSRAYKAIESDDKHGLEIHVESIKSSTLSTLNLST